MVAAENKRSLKNALSYSTFLYLAFTFEINYWSKRLRRFWPFMHENMPLTLIPPPPLPPPASFTTFTGYGLQLIKVGVGMTDKPWCDRVFDCVWPNPILKNTRQMEALYKGTLLRFANGNLPQEDT